MFSGSKLQFLFANEQKQLARVLPESSAVICARFSGISTNYTATITKCLKKFFAAGVPRNERSRVLGVRVGFFSKKRKILIFVTNLQIKI